MSRRSMKLSETLSSVMARQNVSIKAVEHSLSSIAEDSFRTAQIMGNVSSVIDEIEHDFEQTTRLQKQDIAFLFIATGLQCLRQYVIPSSSHRLSATEGDKFMEKFVPKDWQDILCSSVPYDAIRVDPDFKAEIPDGTGLGGSTHRVLTLGHDPMFGWVFGTSNILCDALTKTDFITTYKVSDMRISGYYEGSTLGMLNDSYAQIQADRLLLPVALARQAIHFGSDYFTKQGLPLPVIGSINSQWALRLANKFNIDMYGTMRSAALSIMINLIIAYVHSLLYNKETDGSESSYEVRTRRIVSYSNIIATSSNVVYTAVNACVGNAAAVKNFDFGGLLVTLYKLFTDRKKIIEIKKEFLSSEFYNKVNA